MYTNEREYWEQGCLCIVTGRVEKANVSVADEDACALYERHCKCTRGFDESKRDAELEKVMREELGM